MKLRQEYQGLSRQELLDKAYEAGVKYHKNSLGCSQCTVAALRKLLGFDDVVVKVATSLAGGTALQYSGACGALAGGVIVLDYYFGRPVENVSDKETIQDNLDRLYSAFKAPQLLADKFVNEYGTIICSQLHRQFLGRIYYLLDPEEKGKFVKAGGSEKCDEVVGKAARWVTEILLDKGAIEL